MTLLWLSTARGRTLTSGMPWLDFTATFGKMVLLGIVLGVIWNFFQTPLAIWVESGKANYSKREDFNIWKAMA